MKQVLQDLASGRTTVQDLPVPQCGRGHLLIQTHYSLISAGTERMLVDFGKSGYLDKARQQPEKVKMVLDKIRTDGLLPTVEAVRSKLDQPIPMGYSNVGRVVQVGESVEGFNVGDIVVSNGPHAEFVSVPKNLCAIVPIGTSLEDATFTVVGAIALQGIRIAQLTMGECVVVTGLGLIGLMTVQLLKAHGCRVLGLDFDQQKLDLARKFGAEVVDLAEGEDPIVAAEKFSRGRGADAVLVTASTKSSDPIHQAAVMSRKRGRIVLVGVTGLELNRADFYEKELSFQVSCSYGPGRYDPSYEVNGQDYPIGFVRWTEQRNFEAVLDLMSAGALDTVPLKTRSFKLDEAPDAYEFLLNDKGALGVLLHYPEQPSSNSATVRLDEEVTTRASTGAVLGAIGAGNYAGRALLPAFSKTKATLKTISSAGGVSGSHYGRKLGFQFSTTDTNSILEDGDINAVVVATRHDSHAPFVIEALQAGKHVFVEKPLALTLEQLKAIEAAYKRAHDAKTGPILMVGFNRRFSPLAQTLRKKIEAGKAPVSLVYTCNAGAIPADSWVQDLEKGGGRIIGEACHFIDFARFLAGSPIKSVSGNVLQTDHNNCYDTVSISISFDNGSIATVHYFANGHRSFPKERIEVFQAGKVFSLNNFSELAQYNTSKQKSRVWKQNKGQVECCSVFVDAIEAGAQSPIPFPELMEVSKWTIEVANSLRAGE